MLFKSNITTQGECLMGYLDILKIAQHIKVTHRLPMYAQYYKSFNPKGLHYVYQVGKTHHIFLCRPDHSTHPEATAFLFNEYYAKGRINTVKGYAKNLKKFLDFLMFWNLDEELYEIYAIKGEPYPLFVFLEAFCDYLRLIPKGERMNHTVEWGFLTEVPMHELALSCGKVVRLDFDTWDNLQIQEWCQYRPGALNPIVYTACCYLKFLAERTTRLNNLPIVQIPVKLVTVSTKTEGTTGKSKVEIFDSEAITHDIVLLGPGSHKRIQPIELNSVCSQEEADVFFGALNPYEDAQNLLLFTLMRYFGIRSGEAAGVMIDPSSIPDLTNYSQAIKALKSLKGDLNCLYDKLKGVFQGWHINTGWKTTASKRDVPLLSHKVIDHETGMVTRFPTIDEFTGMLYWALVQREMLMKHQGQDHGYLFVSLSRATRGNPIDSSSVYGKFTYIAEKLLDSTNSTGRPIDMTKYSPHTFRHLFATVLLEVYNVPLQDISTWLGHANTDVTRRTYIHWIPKNTVDDKGHGTVCDMGQHFEKQGKRVKK